MREILLKRLRSATRKRLAWIELRTDVPWQRLAIPSLRWFFRFTPFLLTQLITFLVLVPEKDDLACSPCAHSIELLQTLVTGGQVLLIAKEPGAAISGCDWLTPHCMLLDHVLDTAASVAQHDVWCIVDARVSISAEFLRSVKEVLPHIESGSLVIGRSLVAQANAEPAERKCSDYFLFNKNRWSGTNAPPIPLHGNAWKNWLCLDTLRSGGDLVDLGDGGTVWFRGGLEKNVYPETIAEYFPDRARGANLYDRSRCNKIWGNGGIHDKATIYPSHCCERLIAGGPGKASPQAYTTAVAVFLYQRTEELAKVIDCLRMVQPTRVYAIADACADASPESIARCEAARAVLDCIDWPCMLRTNFTLENVGPGRRFKSGIDWVFAHEDEAVFLEDDVIASPDFFQFCSQMLERFRHDPAIASVCGSMFFRIKSVEKDGYFFSRHFPVWGWATWRRAWATMDIWTERWPEIKRRGLLSKWFPDEPEGLAHWTTVFDLAHAWHWDSWDYQWLLHTWINDMVHLRSTRNLASNIGFGADATHCTDDSPWAALPLQSASLPARGPSVPKRNKTVDRILQQCTYAADWKENWSAFRENPAGLEEHAKHQLQERDQKEAQGEPFVTHPHLIPLLHYPNGTPGRCTLPGLGEFRFTDVQSLLAEYADVYCRRLLRFDSAADTPLIVDVGAGPGLAVIFYKKRFPGARVVALEPDPWMFAVLQRNVSERALADVALHQCLPSATNCSQRFERANGEYLAVPGFDLSKLLSKRVELLRINIPGMESQVLVAARSALENVQRVYVHVNPRPERKPRLGETVSLLEEAGFQVYVEPFAKYAKRPFQMSSHALDAIDPRAHIFALRK